MIESLRFYRIMERIGPRSYVGKFLAVAFWATHLPLIALALTLSLSPGHLTVVQTIVVVTVATVLGTALSFVAFRNLLQPVLMVRKELRTYLETGVPTSLPINFRDDAGVLLRDINAVVHELYKQHQSLESAAERDHLTGLANRHRSEKVLKECVRVKNDSSYGTLTVAMLDLDHFKRINDSFGHPAGDQVLVQVSQFLMKNLTQATLVGRWGGEEFLVLLEGSPTEALCLLQSIHDEISQAIEVPRAGSRVTVSIGVVQHHAGETWESLVERADQSLYQAKAQGRDQMVVKTAVRPST